MYELLLSITVAILIIGFIWLLRKGLKITLAAQQTDWGKTGLNYLDGLNRLFCKHYHRLQYTPIELPSQGAAIVVANHLSGLDPLLLVAVTRRPLRFLIAREQYERFGLKWLFQAIGCIPVDRGSRPEIALRAALRALEAGEVIALFPQGTFVLPGESQKIKKGSLWLAEHTNSPIYPAYISGISGMGYIFLSLLWRSHAVIASYPPLANSSNQQLEYLQALLEGRISSSLNEAIN